MRTLLMNLRALPLAALIVTVRVPSGPLQAPAYLREMPSVERVMREVKGSDSTDTAARQSGAFEQLITLISDIALIAGRNGTTVPLAPDEDRLMRIYSAAALRSWTPVKARWSGFSAEQRTKLLGYSHDPGFQIELLNRFFSTEVRALYAKALEKDPARYRVFVELQRRSAGQGQAAPRPAAAAQCPAVSVSSPSEAKEDDPITFTAAVNGADPDATPTYNWTVSAGTISSGQGTSVITVDTQGIGGASVTATVEIGGLDAKCRNSASATTGMAPKPSPARLFDRYGTLGAADQNARLDNLAIQLQSEPMSQGYIVAFASRTSPAGSIATRLKAIKRYLVETRGIESSRLVTVSGGSRARAETELWVVPQGAKPPLR